MGLPSEWLKFAPNPRPLTGDDKWNVFLSYRSVSRSWVLHLYDVLQGLGHKVFIDQRVLKAGDPLAKELEDALDASQAGILIWTNATRDSEWVRREYGVLESMATDKEGFQFVPIKLDASKLPKFAESRLFLDFSSYPDGPNGGELLRLLHAVVGIPLSDEAAHFASEQDEAAIVAAAKITAAVQNKFKERLVKLFEDGGLPWETTSMLGCKTAEGLTKLGANNEAIRMLEALENRFPKAVRPRQLHALALARRGENDDLMDAQNIMGELYAQGERDPETLGIYARTWMDRFKASRDISDLRQSRDYYAEAFNATKDDYYTGINAASKSVFLDTPDDLAKAVAYADQVQQIVGTTPHPGDYWKTATAAEALLIKKQYQQAGQLYEAAVAMARSETASHMSTWMQACGLMEKLGPTADERAYIRKAFDVLPDCDQL
jgi:tetratricopeptide (TPR) repeat protein